MGSDDEDDVGDQGDAAGDADAIMCAGLRLSLLLLRLRVAMTSGGGVDITDVRGGNDGEAIGIITDSDGRASRRGAIRCDCDSKASPKPDRSLCELVGVSGMSRVTTAYRVGEMRALAIDVYRFVA